MKCCDWSSDVCSSDLQKPVPVIEIDHLRNFKHKLNSSKRLLENENAASLWLISNRKSNSPSENEKANWASPGNHQSRETDARTSKPCGRTLPFTGYRIE
jgi:hypothetical protein